MNRVLIATPPGSADLGSFGDASHMLIRQVDFPDTFREDEKISSTDHDRIESWYGLSETDAIFRKHTGRGPAALRGWAEKASKAALLAFCVEVLRADPAVVWTECRILGTGNRSSGHVVWTIEVFAKDPTSATAVYTGADAPNVDAENRPYSDGSGGVFYKRAW